MFSNEKLSRTALPSQDDMFNPQRWRNIQEVIKTTLVSFHQAITGIQGRLTLIQQTQKQNDRDDVVKQLLSITNQQRAVSEKFSQLDINISEQIQRGISKVQPDIESLQSQQQMILQQLSRKVTQDDLTRQLRKVGSSSKKALKKVPEQELYIETNETMFGMIVEEINNLKEGQNGLGQKIAKKSKATLSLHNQMCSKLESIEKEIAILRTKKEDYRQTKDSKHQNQQNKPRSNHRLQEFYDNLKVSNLSEILSQLQKDLHQKAYLKDIMQLIQNSIAPVQESVESMRLYFESNMTSTNKILNHQTVINEQLCKQMRLGRWQWSGTANPKLNMLPWQKQLINLYPQSLLWTKNTASLVIRQPGLYLFNITLIDANNPNIGLVINKSQIRYSIPERSGFSTVYTDVVKVQKNSSVSVFCDGKNGSALLVIKRI